LKKKDDLLISDLINILKYILSSKKEYIFNKHGLINIIQNYISKNNIVNKKVNNLIKLNRLKYRFENRYLNKSNPIIMEKTNDINDSNNILYLLSNNCIHIKKEGIYYEIDIKKGFINIIDEKSNEVILENNNINYYEIKNRQYILEKFENNITSRKGQTFNGGLGKDYISGEKNIVVLSNNNETIVVIQRNYYKENFDFLGRYSGQTEFAEYFLYNLEINKFHPLPCKKNEFIKAIFSNDNKYFLFQTINNKYILYLFTNDEIIEKAFFILQNNEWVFGTAYNIMNISINGKNLFEIKDYWSYKIFPKEKYCKYLINQEIIKILMEIID